MQHFQLKFLLWKWANNIVWETEENYIVLRDIDQRMVPFAWISLANCMPVFAFPIN